MSTGGSHDSSDSSEPDGLDGPNMPSGKLQSLKALGRSGGVGVEMVVFIVLGVKGGQWLDGRMGTEYWVLVGLAFGLFAGFRSLLQLTRRPTSQSTPGEEQLPNAATSESSKRTERGGPPKQPPSP